MKTPRITVVGSFAVGMTIRAPKLPIFGETMLGTDFDMGPGGKGSNQAVATARLGARSSLLAMVGDDKLAGIATDLYSAEGVDASLVTTRAERATGVGFIILNAKGENFIILDMGANELLDAEAVDAGEAQIAASDVVMTVLEVPTSAAARAMELGCKHGVTTILNPAPARALPHAIFESVDYLTPNESELRILLGLPADDPRSSRELAQELRRRGVRNVITTLGRDGAMILTDTLDVRSSGDRGRGHRHDRRRRRLQLRLCGGAGGGPRPRRGGSLRRGVRRHRMHQARRDSEPPRSRAGGRRVRAGIEDSLEG